MVEIKRRQILIDGKPKLLIGGEIHYYRLHRSDWQDRIDKLKSTGANMVASYIPWLVHEQQQGHFDLSGQARPEYDVEGFIDLVAKNDMYFLARPGPFVMAEMKNEGIPHWVARVHPEIVPLGWDGNPALGGQIDYLAPAFLSESRHWYSAIIPVLAKRRQSQGGPVIGVQLDNEVGMLAWVGNHPELTDFVLEDFVKWLRLRYSEAALRTRYPLDLGTATARAALRSPSEAFAAEFRVDLGRFMRDRSGRYFRHLQAYAEEFGMGDTLFAVNIHGTSAGRALPYPIGISQLYESYPGWDRFFAGSDHYLSELGVGNVQDLYLINMLTDCVNGPDQPLTALEFSAGSGDFGGSYHVRIDPSSVDFHLRMSVAQNTRLVNFYLFCGSWNWKLNSPENDGNDRIGITGERHGTAAPIDPEGRPWIGFDRMSRGIGAMMAFADKLGATEEEHDDVEYGFIPDYFMTENHYPKSEKMKAVVKNLEEYRSATHWDTVVKALLFNGFRFTARDLQKHAPDPKKALVVGTAAYMDGALQQKLVDFARDGGRLLLFGEVPEFDLEARPCTTLADALGVKPGKVMKGWRPHYYLAVQPVGPLSGHPEYPPHFAQPLVLERGEVLMTIVDGERPCAAEIPLGAGKVVLFAGSYRTEVAFWQKVFDRLGLSAGLTNDYWDYGIFATTSRLPGTNERFLHIMNLDNVDKPVRFFEDGQPLFEGRQLHLRGKEAVMVPLMVKAGQAEIAWATCEVMEMLPDGLRFRLTQPEDVIVFAAAPGIAESTDYSVEPGPGSSVRVVSKKPACLNDNLVVRWA
ncbi:MAG: beta-galactosidase [Fimbriimonadaceae bacterium]|nr:beta-galactosidase [Fimbriimonadaceae bacterium]QYK56991.1 MAG: beta-galactosidase [Fimbriimonadaceae bacterium]